MQINTALSVSLVASLAMLGCAGDGASSSSTEAVDDANDTTPLGDANADLSGDASEDADVVSVPTPQLCDLTTPLTALPELIDLWWWEGEPTPQRTVSLVEAPAGCTFAMDVSHEWLEAELIGATVKITIHPEAAPPGRLTGEVRVIGAQASAATLIPVTAHLWSAPTAGATPMALVIGIDGVRPDAAEAAHTPYLDLVARGGASSMIAHTQLTAPTKSGPGWASILTGVDADKHGVESNDMADMDQKDPQWPSIFERAKLELGLTTAAIINWIPVAVLLPAVLADHYETGSDVEVGSKAATSLRENDHRLTFVHLDEVDGHGHGTGFSKDNPLYIGAIELSDVYVGQMLTAIEDRPTFPLERWLIVVTTDHGGAGTSHGPMDADNQTIWFMAAGPEIPQQVLGAEVSHMDTHPTVMAHLGLWPQESWALDGQVVGVTPPADAP